MPQEHHIRMRSDERDKMKQRRRSWSFVKQAVKLKKTLRIIIVNFRLSFSFSRWMSVIGRRPSPLTSSEPRFARHDANLFGNYQSRPSISSLVFLGSLCVPLTWGHIKYRPSEVNNPIVISNPISNLQYVVLRYKWQRQQEGKKNQQILSGYFFFA